ncbi:MAG: hypothetical protein L3K23_06365 [Thermoplasmata archaeon]|nr:hypothetical protein [Thermoplasmata archaeon]
MILPGLISLAFYKRRPTGAQIFAGLAATIALSAVLGYVSPPGPPTQLGSVIVAIVGGVLLYAAILVFLLYRYQPRRAGAPPPPRPTPPT